MVSRRIERLNEQFKREISDIVRNEVKDPRVGSPVVTAVEASPDLTFARAYILAPGDSAAQEQTLAGLRAAAPFIRGELGRRMRVRRAPELRFELDRGLERALRIERLLREAKEEGRAPEGGEAERDAADER